MKKCYRVIILMFILVPLQLSFLSYYVQAQSINGIDISNNNGSINWNDIKSEGVSNVIIKATEGVDYRDCNLNTNYYNAINSGMNVGFYHFFSNYTNPSQQAQDFYNAIKDKPYNITPVLDIETDRLNVSKFEMTSRALEFLRAFEALSGQKCMIYSYTSFINEELDYMALLNYKLWIANYSNNCRYPIQWQPNYAGWQFTEDYYIGGSRYDANEFTDKIYLDNVSVQVSNTIASIQETENIYLTLQKELNVQGFRDRNENVLSEDGIPGQLTLSACPLVKQGAEGNITRWIQLRCGAVPDGVYGPDTKQAIKYMQQMWGIKDDGIVGPLTWRHLLNLE